MRIVQRYNSIDLQSIQRGNGGEKLRRKRREAIATQISVEVETVSAKAGRKAAT